MLVIVIIVFVWLVMVVPWVHTGPNIKSIYSEGLNGLMCTTSVLSIIVCVLRDMGRGLVRLGRAL